MDTSINNSEEYKEYYQTICEISPVGLFRTDNDGNIIYVNKLYEELTGTTLKNLKYDGWIKYIHERDLTMVLTEWQRCVRERLKFALEFRIKKSDGKIIWVLGQATPVNSKSGYVGTITNINKRKKLINELIALKEAV